MPWGRQGLLGGAPHGWHVAARGGRGGGGEMEMKRKIKWCQIIMGFGIPAKDFGIYSEETEESVTKISEQDSNDQILPLETNLPAMQGTELELADRRGRLGK